MVKSYGNILVILKCEMVTLTNVTTILLGNIKCYQDNVVVTTTLIFLCNICGFLYQYNNYLNLEFICR